MSALLELDGVEARYGPVQALRGITLEVAEGEVVAVLGANGAGKTTALRAISGTVRRSGRISFGGKPLRGGPEAVARAGIAHVPEGRGTFTELSVLENLRLGAYTRRERNVRADVDRVSRKLGRRLKFVVGKPGLDGHSNGAEQIAARARDAGMDVIYEGIRLTPAEIVEAAREQRAHVVGLSILSGSHLPLVKDVVARMKNAGLDDVPVVVGGIIPPEDARALQQAGVAAVYTPKDFELNRIMADIVRIVDRVEA